MSVKWPYIAVSNTLYMSHRYGNSHAPRDHTILSDIRQKWHSRLYVTPATLFSDTGRDGRRNWPSWLVTNRNGIPVRWPTRSPIPVLTRPDVGQLFSYADQRKPLLYATLTNQIHCYRFAKYRTYIYIFNSNCYPRKIMTVLLPLFCKH